MRPHEVRVLFAGDQDADMNARIEHLFAAGPSARLTLRIHESKETMDVDITRFQLEEMGLSEGDEIGIQLSRALEIGLLPSRLRTAFHHFKSRR